MPSPPALHLAPSSNRTTSHYLLHSRSHLNGVKLLELTILWGLLSPSYGIPITRWELAETQLNGHESSRVPDGPSGRPIPNPAIAIWEHRLEYKHNGAIILTLPNRDGIPFQIGDARSTAIQDPT
uniref:Uncharacterized protein n=1 Tax=Coccidioides posadasii RMSCC 3488 TaxID=454284 RepID=A0A0J6I8F3_COCPO|nr:hypothetical protein CPAG_04115 [Coccidioides posadasii RMSCC 3488]